MLLCIVSGNFFFFFGLGGSVLVGVGGVFCFLWGGFGRGEILYFEGMGEVCGVGCLVVFRGYKKDFIA